MLHMVLEALQAGEQHRGTSVMAIKVYICGSTLRWTPSGSTTCRSGPWTRACSATSSSGPSTPGPGGHWQLQVSFQAKQKKIQPRKTATVSAPRRPGEVKEEAPKKDGQTKGEEARGGKARKALHQPDKATEAPPGASGPHGKSKIKGKKDSPADAKAHRKTKAGTQSSKPTVPKSENGVTSPAKKKTGNKVLKEATAPGARKGSKAKAAAAPKDSESKMVPEPLTRKTEVPRGPRMPGMSTKASSSKETSMKAEAKS